MRLHLVSLPHTQCTKEYAWCAFTQKCRKFATMMTKEKFDVILYAGLENDALCLEHVVVADPPATNAEYSPEYSSENPIFRKMNRRAIAELEDRLEPHDIICLIGGNAQRPIADAFPNHMTVEFGIGYEGVFANYRVFESYAWMHVIYGHLYGANAANGRFYDCVIPNYFEVDEFPQGSGGDYLLYFGRLTERKGLEVVKEVAKRTGLPLKIAGQGTPPNIGEYVGVIRSAEERAELMGGARAILVPTLYLEPFGAVAVEAQLTGTPAITTDFGAFTETVEDGKTGFRCHTIAEFVQAANYANKLDRNYIREHAIAKYSTETIGPQYTRYFNRLETLWDKGWYT